VLGERRKLDKLNNARTPVSQRGREMLNVLTPRNCLRFTLRELFYACILVGLGFVWPILFVFVLPILLAAVLNRMGFVRAVPVIIAAGLSILFGAVISYSLWRYPFYPPPLIAELRNVDALHQLSSFKKCTMVLCGHFGDRRLQLVACIDPRIPCPFSLAPIQTLGGWEFGTLNRPGYCSIPKPATIHTRF
jgi:hypothetical protein